MVKRGVLAKYQIAISRVVVCPVGRCGDGQTCEIARAKRLSVKERQPLKITLTEKVVEITASQFQNILSYS